MLSFEVSFMLRKLKAKKIELAFDKKKENSKLTDFSVYPVIELKINVTYIRIQLEAQFY